MSKFLTILDKSGKPSLDTIKLFYREFPFSIHVSRQTPGNVIKYLFIELTKHTKERGVESLFHKLFDLLTIVDVSSFEPIECSTILHRAVFFLNVHSTVKVPVTEIKALLEQMNRKIKDANTLDCSITLWAVAKLYSLKSRVIEWKWVAPLLDELCIKSRSASPQELSNGLWAIGRAIEAGVYEQGIKPFNWLLRAINESRMEMSIVTYTNSFWAIAKVVDSKLPGIDMREVKTLFYNFSEKMSTADPVHIQKAFWLIGKLAEAKILDIDMKVFNNMLDALLRKRGEGNDIAIAQALWAIGKLLEADVPGLDVGLINYLLAGYLHSLKEIEMQSFTNALWALGKIAEMRVDIDIKLVNPFFTIFMRHSAIADYVDFSIALSAFSKLLEGHAERLDLGVFAILLSKLSIYAGEADCQALALGIWSAGKLVEAGIVEIDVDSINILLHNLSLKSLAATEKNITNALWGVGKMLDNNINRINLRHVDSLLLALSKKLSRADMADVTKAIWVTAKLLKCGADYFDISVINTILENMSSKAAMGDPQNLSITLWATGKLIVGGFGKHLTLSFVPTVINEFTKGRTRCSPTNLANAIWGCGVLNTHSKIAVPKELVKYAIDSVCARGDISDKNKLLAAIFHLGLEGEYDLSLLIPQCRPPSTFKPSLIPLALREGIVSVEREAFVCGFYVDALITYKSGQQIILEIDGPWQLESWRNKKDIFRDNLLSKTGYHIIRLNLLTGGLRHVEKAGSSVLRAMGPSIIEVDATATKTMAPDPRAVPDGKRKHPYEEDRTLAMRRHIDRGPTAHYVEEDRAYDGEPPKRMPAAIPKFPHTALPHPREAVARSAHGFFPRPIVAPIPMATLMLPLAGCGAPFRPPSR